MFDVIELTRRRPSVRGFGRSRARTLRTPRATDGFRIDYSESIRGKRGIGVRAATALRLRVATAPISHSRSAAILPAIHLGEKLDDGAPCVVGALAICNRQTAGRLEVLGNGMIDEGREWTAASDARHGVTRTRIDVDFHLIGFAVSRKPPADLLRADEGKESTAHADAICARDAA
jgi:hypothetical protein